ncbi:MAG: HAMP domain-containing sensor histidine kinase [Kiritimatiellia bacterium]
MKMIGRWRPSLRTSLVLYVLTPLGVAMVLTGYFALKHWEHQVESRMQSDLEMVARAIQLPLSHAVERNRQGGVEQSLKSAISMDSVYSAYTYDLEGERIASAGREDPDPQREKLTTLATEGRRIGEYGHVGERRVYSYFVPLVDSRNQTAGLLQLTRRERDFRNYIAVVRKHATLWFGIGTLMMVILVLIGQHQALGRHFALLTAGMQRVAAGEVGYRLALAGPKEIVSISASFNSMLDSIQQAENEIQRNRREQLALEQQLRQSEKMAAVGQLAAGVAHEIGTPMSTISGTAQRALRYERDNARGSEAFRRIQREITRMEIIVRQLLDFSHNRKLQYRDLRPVRVAESAVAATAEEAASRHVEICVCGDPDAASFPADPVRIEQALVNLLRNAVQADAIRVVRLEWKVSDNAVVFAIDDDGAGIPEEIRPRLFEPFFTTKSVGQGTGLGLAVVHGILQEHGGSVQVGESNRGGARIEISLPLKPSTYRNITE